MRRASSRKLALWSALPPYLGGKRRLCPLIFREIDRVLPRRNWRGRTFLDGFLGGGSVSLYAKAQGFRVVATDIAERAITVGEALIANSRVRLTREDVLRLASPSEAPAGRIERDYAPRVFTQEQARFLDRALAIAAETGDQSRAALYRLLAIRVGMLCHPMSQVRAGTIHRVTSGEFESITESCVYHYIDALRLTRPGKLWELAHQINAGVFQGEGQVIRGSILDLLPGIEADVAYFDPPYPGVMSYEREYKTIDEILEGASRPTSPFTAKGGAAMLDTLFERATHIPVWLLSLGNAVVRIEELEAKMTRFGRTTKGIAVRYQHLPAVATAEKKRENREFLVVGWDAESPLLAGLSVQGHGVSAGLDEAHAVAHVEENADLRGAELPAVESGTGDLDEHGDACLGEEVAALGRRPVPKAGGHADHPDSFGVERGSDRAIEGDVLGRARESRALKRHAAPGSHDATFPWDAGAGQAHKEDRRE